MKALGRQEVSDERFKGDAEYNGWALLRRVVVLLGVARRWSFASAPSSRECIRVADDDKLFIYEYQLPCYTIYTKDKDKDKDK